MLLMDLQRRINQPVSHRARRNLGRHLLAASYRAFLDPEQTALGCIAQWAKPRLRNTARRPLGIFQLGEARAGCTFAQPPDRLTWGLLRQAESSTTSVHVLPSGYGSEA